MISVVIGGMSVPQEKASEGWVNQMIADARRRGVTLCVQVSINEPGVQLLLSAPSGCGGGGGAGRQANDRERRIIDQWHRRGLNDGQFSPGQLRAFLNDITRLI
jgi:hypothetical protein